MTRNRFGGDQASWVFDAIGGYVITPTTDQHLTCWSGDADTLSRVQYTDLRDPDAPSTPISTITVLASGQVPEFLGPDDAAVTRMWVSADDGVTGVWMASTSISKAGATGQYADLTGKPTIPAAPGDIGAQPADADLTALATLTTTAYGRALLELANQAGLLALLPAASQSALGLARFASPSEVTAGTATDRVVSPADVKSRIDALVNGAPGALDTLKEISDQLASDESAAGALTTLVTSIRNLSDSTLSASLSAAYAGPGTDPWLKLIAQEFGFVFTGGLTVDSTTGLPTAGAVKWPDGKTGTFAGTVDANYYTGFTVTWVNGGTAKTVTVTGISYDAASGLPLGPTGLAVA